LALTATKLLAGASKLTYRLDYDGVSGTGSTLLLSNATLTGDMIQGPLRDLWRYTYPDAPSARRALVGFGDGATVMLEPITGAIIWSCNMTVDGATLAQLTPNANAGAVVAIGFLSLIHIRSLEA
jgi:hypothetical protein